MGKAAVAFPLLLKYTGVPERVLRFVIVIYLYLIYLCIILTNVLFCYLDKQLKKWDFSFSVVVNFKGCAFVVFVITFSSFMCTFVFVIVVISCCYW